MFASAAGGLDACSLSCDVQVSGDGAAARSVALGPWRGAFGERSANGGRTSKARAFPRRILGLAVSRVHMFGATFEGRP